MSSRKGIKMDISVRWMRREDMAKVASIRKKCDLEPELLGSMVGDSFSICKVAEVGGKIVGFMAYKNGRKRTKLLEVAVSPSFRRRGVATLLLDSMLSKMNFDMKNLEAVVSEYNLPTQMLLKKSGFLAVEVIRSNYESEYRFVKSASPNCTSLLTVAEKERAV